jgi:hypothetical protein
VVKEVARTIGTLLRTLPERDGSGSIPLDTEGVSREAIEAALATVAEAMSRVS